MREIKAHYIGGGLYDVFVDGEKYGAPCELDRLAMIYDDMLEENDENNEHKNGTACAV